jgi:uncharacterized protein involved in exopolysaccharide biosynthesis
VCQTIAPAFVPELKFKSKGALIVVLGALLGGTFSIFIALIRHFAAKRKAVIY